MIIDRGPYVDLRHRMHQVGPKGRHFSTYQYAAGGCEGRPQASPGRLRVPAQTQGSE
jgi:hypothetical protein